jgi:hypothetical protein
VTTGIRRTQSNSLDEPSDAVTGAIPQPSVIRSPSHRGFIGEFDGIDYVSSAVGEVQPLPVITMIAHLVSPDSPWVLGSGWLRRRRSTPREGESNRDQFLPGVERPG